MEHNYREVLSKIESVNKNFNVAKTFLIPEDIIYETLKEKKIMMI